MKFIIKRTLEVSIRFQSTYAKYITVHLWLNLDNMEVMNKMQPEIDVLRAAHS